MNEAESDNMARAEQLRKAVAERLRTMTPQERDRRMQTLLAQARGPAGNALLLRQMTAMILAARAAQQADGAANE